MRLIVVTKVERLYLAKNWTDSSPMEKKAGWKP
jgi:hypothetical protein